MADKILLTVNKMRCRILLWKKSMCTLFKHDCRSEDACDRRCSETRYSAACTYREPCRRSPSKAEAAEKDWLEKQLAVRLRKWGLPSSTISPRERMRSLSKLQTVEGRCEMTISVDVLKLRRMFARTNFSEGGSRQEVASSNIKMRGRCSIALASASRWR
jgi:hypothetical protein